MQHGYEQKKYKLLSRQRHLQMDVRVLSPPRFFLLREALMLVSHGLSLRKKTKHVLQDERENQFLKSELLDTKAYQC